MNPRGGVEEAMAKADVVLERLQPHTPTSNGSEKRDFSTLQPSPCSCALDQLPFPEFLCPSSPKSLEYTEMSTEANTEVGVEGKAIPEPDSSGQFSEDGGRTNPPRSEEALFIQGPLCEAFLRGCRFQSLPQIHVMARSDSDPEESFRDASMRPGRSPAEQFAPLASTFRRRILVSVGSASLVALGADFAGITSSILGLSPETGRGLKLDVLYPIKGYRRCIETNEGFEFIYPASWVGDQTLLYRAVGKAELERGLDPPPLNRRRQNVNEPIVAFGPPSTNGELNVSVIVSTVPLDFSIESFGGPEEVGEAIVQTIVGSSRRPDVKGSLVKSTLREDPSKMVKYYELEFRVESSSFRRHNIAICCTRQGKLYTLNAQAPELAWPEVKSDFYTIAESFVLTS